MNFDFIIGSGIMENPYVWQILMFYALGIAFGLASMTEHAKDDKRFCIWVVASTLSIVLAVLLTMKGMNHHFRKRTAPVAVKWDMMGDRPEQLGSRKAGNRIFIYDY